MDKSTQIRQDKYGLFFSRELHFNPLLFKKYDVSEKVKQLFYTLSKPCFHLPKSLQIGNPLHPLSISIVSEDRLQTKGNYEW